MAARSTSLLSRTIPGAWWGRQSCLQAGFQPAAGVFTFRNWWIVSASCASDTRIVSASGPAGKRVGSQDWLPHISLPAIVHFCPGQDTRRAGARIFCANIALLLLAALSLAAATRYPVTGIILKVDRPHRSFEASCAAIPGYMEAMEMPYSVLRDRELADLKPGAYVDFTLVVEKEHSYAEGIHIHRYESSEREPMLARRLQLLEAPHAILKPGDAVPDFTLIDQTGRRVTLSQSLGKVVAVTFIYTSCPLPDYCFRLANNFGQLNQRFAGRMGRDLVLLSISFDPVHDQPKVLAKYASTWKADPESWHFLTGPLDEVKAVSRRFGLNFWPDDVYVTHSLHTLVIDRGGRLAADFEGNQFTARQLGDYVEVLMSGR
jgi:protein SCO1